MCDNCRPDVKPLAICPGGPYTCGFCMVNGTVHCPDQRPRN